MSTRNTSRTATARNAAETGAADGPAAAMAAAWNRYWFTPTDSRPLALVRIGTAAVALMLWWSYAADVQTWFGPAGVLPVDTVRQWRSPAGFSLFDWASTSASLSMLFGGLGVMVVLLLVGLATPVVAVLSAVLWASLLHRGPMLAGPADDCLSILLWCLAVGPAGEHFSIDRWLGDRAGRPAPGPSVRAGIATGLLQVHASAIAVAAVLAQLKGDAWWNGLAAWYLAAGPQSLAADLMPLLARSEYLTNLLTHSITAFEIMFAVLLWYAPTQRLVARIGLAGWPLLGLLAGEPLWGLSLALFALPLALSGRHGRGVGDC
jgi:hypothetical protein